MQRRRLHSTANDLVESLSPRRREVLELLAKGLTNDDIARILHVSPGTVRIHVTALLSELQVANRTEAAAAYFEWKSTIAKVSEILHRPAIAVLAFESLDRNKKSQLRAAALTQDLAILFARWCWFPVVVAPNVRLESSLAFSSRELGHTVGARFLVGGSVRAAKDAWRLAIRIDDAEEERCIWAEKFEFSGEELFDVQDEVCATIVANAYDVLVKGLSSQVLSRNHPEALDPWMLAHEGMLLHGARESQSNAKARSCFERALERDANLVLAHFGLGLCHYDELLNQWQSNTTIDRLLASAERCIELAPHAAEGYFLLGRYYQARGKHVDGLQPLEMAVARNPSAATAHALMAQLLSMSGQFDEGLARMRHASRLSPRSFVAGLAVLHFLRHEDHEALEHAERALTLRPKYAFARVIAASSAYWLGDLECARKHVQALFLDNPSFSAEKFFATFGGPHGWVERIAKALALVG